MGDVLQFRGPRPTRPGAGKPELIRVEEGRWGIVVDGCVVYDRLDPVGRRERIARGENAYFVEGQTQQGGTDDG